MKLFFVPVVEYDARMKAFVIHHDLTVRLGSVRVCVECRTDEQRARLQEFRDKPYVSHATQF